jgi:hypothetical protein
LSAVAQKDRRLCDLATLANFVISAAIALALLAPLLFMEASSPQFPTFLSRGGPTLVAIIAIAAIVAIASTVARVYSDAARPNLNALRESGSGNGKESRSNYGEGISVHDHLLSIAVATSAKLNGSLGEQNDSGTDRRSATAS